MGYHMAGFEIWGVDIEPQPNYPFKFVQGDVLELDPRKVRRNFDAVAASPPCLGYTNLRHTYPPHIRHEKLIPATRDLLDEIDRPYIMENVQGAVRELINPIKLCGSSFGLRVRRHRFFETNWICYADPPACNHSWQDRHKVYRIHMSKSRGGSRMSGIVAVYGGGQMMIPPSGREWEAYNVHHGSVAMGIDWMNRAELNQAIPPLYTYWLGRQLMRSL